MMSVHFQLLGVKRWLLGKCGGATDGEDDCVFKHLSPTDEQEVAKTIFLCGGGWRKRV